MTSMLGDAFTHTCPKSTCPRRVKNSQYACSEHWFQVDLPTRRAIVRAFTAGDVDAHLQAMREAAAQLNGGTP